MILAHLAGIKVFVTGGIGGVRIYQFKLIIIGS
jgi:pseudouridine-5'-phosphate glycosidase